MFWQLQTINIHNINPESAIPIKAQGLGFFDGEEKQERKKTAEGEEKHKKNQFKQKERIHDILFSIDLWEQQTGNFTYAGS